MRAYMAELIALAADLIVALSPPYWPHFFTRTRTIPIVFVQDSDAVRGGLVEKCASGRQLGRPEVSRIRRTTSKPCSPRA
jgi:hypothetical protein